jgi:hypothetical protein
VSITVDGVEWPRERWGRPVAIDPGEHVLRVDAPLETPPPARFTVGEGEQVRRWIQLPARHGSRRHLRRNLCLVAIGLGAGATIAGGLAGIDAIGTWHDARDAGCDDQGRCRSDTGTALLADAHRRADEATWLIGVGAVTVAAGLVIWLIARDDERPSTGWTITPTASVTGPGAELTVAW